MSPKETMVVERGVGLIGSGVCFAIGVEYAWNDFDLWKGVNCSRRAMNE